MVFLMSFIYNLAAYMSSPCHIELILSEKEEPVKKEVFDISICYFDFQFLLYLFEILIYIFYYCFDAYSLFDCVAGGPVGNQ